MIQQVTQAQIRKYSCPGVSPGAIRRAIQLGAISLATSIGLGDQAYQVGAGGYSLATDPRVLSWYEPDNGFSDKAFSSQWGALGWNGTAGTTVSGLDGNPAWQILAKAGTTGFLKAAGSTIVAQPLHVFLITQALNTPAALDTWWSGNGGPRTCFKDSTHSELVCSSVLTSPACVPANYTLHEGFFQGSQSRMSVNGSAYTAASPTGTGSTFMGGMTFGDYTGVNKSDHNLMFCLVYEGQMPDAARTVLWAYLRAKFPSLSLPATMPTAFLNTISDSGHLLGGSFDIIPVLGQSNATAKATAATIAPNAGILQLGEDNLVKQLVSAFCSVTNQVDMVASAGTQSIGSWIGSFSNTYQASAGRQLVIVPCAVGGSFIKGPNAAVSYAVWDPNYIRGNRQRNALFWSAVYRVQQLQALGGTVRFAVCCQGEAEASISSSTSDPYYVNWPAQFTSTMDQFFAAVGTPKRVVYSQNCSTVPPGTAGQWGNFRANQQPAAQSASQLMVSVGTTTEGDLTHWDQLNCDTIAGPGFAGAAIGAGW